MKKILGLLVVVLMLCFVPLCGNYLHAKASEIENKEYLIEANYKDNASNYGILSDEIKESSTPFDHLTKKMMKGQSIEPAINNSVAKTFEKTFNINQVNIDYGQSVYMYIYFSEILAHDLKISISDGENSLKWEIASDNLMKEIVQDAGSSNLRFGWMLLELPVAAAEEVGELTVATQMTMVYSAKTVNVQNIYSRIAIYAPYVESSNSTIIKFNKKQNFYNFKMSWDNAFNNFCKGDTYEINDWFGLFEYCIIGDIDFLKYNLNLYKFKLEVFDPERQTTTKIMFADGFEYKFKEEGSYTFRVSLYDAQDQWLCSDLDKNIYINEFIAIYISNGLPRLKEGASALFKVNKSPLLIDSNSLAVVSSDNNIAEVTMVGDKIQIKAKKAGKVTITLSINGLRTGADEQVYSNSYVLNIEKVTTNSWITIIISGIGLLICGTIVYIIMVKKRLIPGKYPKY